AEAQRTQSPKSRTEATTEAQEDNPQEEQRAERRTAMERRPPAQAQQAQSPADPNRVPVRVVGSSRSRHAQPPAPQRGMTRQPAAARRRTIGAGYQYGMIDTYTRAALKDRVLRQDPRLFNIVLTGDLYRDLRAMAQVLQ